MNDNDNFLGTVLPKTGSLSEQLDRIAPVAAVAAKEKYEHSSGATSSKIKLRFDLVPEIFNVRVAQRYTLGADKHGDYNYRKGITSSSYLQERIAHLRQHLSNFLLEGNDKDDNLAAIAWCCAFLMEAEQIPAGKSALRQALNVMNYTPVGTTNDKPYTVNDVVEP